MINELTPEEKSARLARIQARGGTSSMIVSAVCNEHRNSDLRADNPDILRALNERFEALEKIADDWEAAAKTWKSNYERLEAVVMGRGEDQVR